MEVAGVKKEVDFAKLGPTLVIASSLILAIRTARWPRLTVTTGSSPEWNDEIDHSINMARRVLSHLASKSPTLFHQKDVPWYQPSEDESPK